MGDAANRMAILASIEKVLMETGADYNLVLAKLGLREATLMDCCENPEYLNEALIDVFGLQSKEIINDIIENLVDFDDNKEISMFITKLRKL